MESMWVRIARVPWAQLQRSPKSMRRRTSSADQRVLRSAATVRSALANVPSGFGARSQVWALSRCVWTSIRHGQSWPRARSTRGSGPSAPPAGTTATIRPSRIATSTRASPSASTGTPGGSSARSVAGTEALQSQYASRSGTVTKPAVIPHAPRRSRATCAGSHTTPQ